MNYFQKSCSRNSLFKKVNFNNIPYLLTSSPTCAYKCSIFNKRQWVSLKPTIVLTFLVQKCNWILCSYSIWIASLNETSLAFKVWLKVIAFEIGHWNWRTSIFHDWQSMNFACNIAALNEVREISINYPPDDTTWGIWHVLFILQADWATWADISVNVNLRASMPHVKHDWFWF